VNTNNLVSPEDYESLVATIEPLRNPEAGQRLREIEDERRRGVLEFVSGEEAERRLFG